MHLSQIQRREAEDTQRYFPDGEFSILYMAVALTGEVGEVCNEIKKLERGDFDILELKARLSGELPDVLIYLVMLAEEMEIDLEQAYRRKKAYNDGRYRRVATETT